MAVVDCRSISSLIHFLYSSLQDRKTCSWSMEQVWSRMPMSWRSAFAVDGVAAALVVGGTLATLLLVSLVSHSTTKKRKKAQASFHLNDENGSVGSSMDSLSITVTAEDEVILGQAELDTDRALGSPDKSLWTAHSAFESDTDEISEAEMQERKEKMRETVVRDDWYVYRREWVRFGKKLAEGGQGEIYAATVVMACEGNELPQEVVVKKFKMFKGISQGHNPPGLDSIKCTNVCRPSGVCFDDGQLCLVMPRLNGDLRAVIDREMKLHCAPPFPALVALHIIMQLATGLKGLHEVGIYHRDLKAGNILVKKMKVNLGSSVDSYKVYVSDFGSSEDITGTLFYRAPEVLRQVQARAEAGMQGRARGSVHPLEHEWAAADVYSFGMICYEILTGEVPMIGDEWSDYSMALSGHRPELPPSMVPDGFRIMIERCWHDDPKCRPTPSEIIECLTMIENSLGVDYGRWLTELEMMATNVEVTGGNLNDHVLELAHLLRHTEPNIPELTNLGTEFLMHVGEFIPKFHALSYLPQQSFPLQKFMELRKLLSLIDLTKCRFLKGTIDLIKAGDDWLRKNDWIRMSELVKKIHAATNKSSLQRSRLAPVDGLPIDEKMVLLRDFVEPQLAAGVWIQHVCIESEVMFRQMSDTKHRWALRRHLLFLCVIYRLRIEALISELASFLSYVVTMLFQCKVLGWILVRVLGKDYSLFWYFDMSPAIGYQLALIRYVGYREFSVWYWRLLYCYLVGYGEGFKYLCLLGFADNVVHNYTAYKQTDFRPHCDFQPINSSTY
ncbi:hypothetical protein KC19_3G224800 [Ceratodon purpureus]|uniref:Protein kinase domain-containing protein n=1 Tax=Ceratodon purpureus TaxID=3225 RepID=A0A8T0IPV0_CERPU|nr:hypothetical protein KC19_3G224800 [Ceratodon purpureus]